MQGALPKPRWIRFDKVFTLSENSIVKTFGALSPQTVQSRIAGTLFSRRLHPQMSVVAGPDIMLPTPRFSATAQDTPALELFRFIANDLGDQSLHCAELIDAREQPSLSTRSSLPLTWMCGTVLTVEHFFTCPSCGEEISMVLDLSG